MNRMALLAVLFLFSALCSGQLLDDQDIDAECLGEDVFQCESGGCVTRDQYCDGVPDCPDATDEYFCPSHLPDPRACNEMHFHFLCADQKKCIPNSWVCNNETECDDGSDEANCTTGFLDIPANSSCKGFQCDGNKTCISRLWICDGIYDCADKSDEYSQEVCGHSLLSHSLQDVSICYETPNTGARHYRCIDSSLCLPKILMCDGMRDCRDGSDEGPFCEHWHTMCDEGSNPCKGNHTTCHPERFGPSCTCRDSPAMKQYNDATGLCEDIDECAQTRPQCSHICENVNGHFKCHCDDGYTADPYRYLCYANGPEAMLFFTTKSAIRYLKIKTNEQVLVATDIKQAHGVSYDGKYLYWVETAQGHQAITRAHLDDIKNTQQVLVSLGLEDPGDIAIDWVGGHIYFTDVHRGTISVCKTDGSICATLRTNAKQPRFVTLAVRHGRMYWADWHHRPLIMEANMDGSSPQICVDSLATFATGLALDISNGRLYFVDKTIRVFKIDDRQTYPLFEEPFHHPYSIAVFENTVFWSDWTSNTIQTTDKVHGTMQKRNVVASLDTPVYDMHVYHPVLFNDIHNPCENKTCSHLCLLSSNTTAVCVCPDGMALKGNDCEHIDGYHPLYLVVGGGSSFTRVDYNSLGNPEAHSTHFDIGGVQAMAYDNTRDTLYVYDGQQKSLYFISMADFTLGVMHLMTYRGLDNVVDMDYDYASDSLYLVDAGRRFIEVISLQTQQRALIIRFRNEIPISICVMPDYGRMLVAIVDTEHDNAISIDSIGLDGEDRRNIIMNDLQGPRVRLGYDQNMDVVYITDEGNSIIDLMHPEGTGRENFRQLSSIVTSIAVTDPYVFWTDWRTRLYWSNVHEATHYIRKMDFSIFPNNSLLHIQATSPPPDPHNPLLSHPCRTTHPCSHVCVQTPHPPSITHRSRANSSSLNFKCLCPPGLLIVDGQCTLLAQCKENEIYCHKRNACIKNGKYCDGFKDCSDGEDEEGCEEQNPRGEEHGCSTGYKLCDNTCIENSRHCGPEKPTTTSTTPEPMRCEEDEFRCTNSTICISRSQVCDKVPDCLNGSDEAPGMCKFFVCQSHEFMCTLGSCIPEVFKCDGEDDCADGSDEVDCEEKSCGLGYYQCRSKQCIELRKRCDGQQDCVDLSDEDGCEEHFIVPEEVSQTPLAHCADGEYPCELNRSICIPRTARCNMKVDCPGRTDEAGCDFRCSKYGMYECKQEFLCVEMNVLCDGRKDCLDGTDETQEACSKVNKTSRLYPLMLRPAAECRHGFLCENGQCLEWRQVCDRRPDCYDESDENGLCSTACENNTCAFSCQPTPKGGHCQCAPGLRATNSYSCVDEDECTRHVCSQVCHNLPGSFVCSCHHGYALRPDRRSCKATKADLSILYMSGNTVWSIAADGKGSVLYNDPKNAAITDIDVDVRNQKLYVSLTEAGQLVQVNSSSNDVTVSNIGRPTKLAVDWITGSVYFVDVNTSINYIRVCNVWKKRCARLQKLPLNTKVTALVLDPPSGRMFYCTTRGASSIVWSASLAGLNVADLVIANNCSGLAVDSFKKLVYVAEANPPRIFRVDFNGKNVETMLDDHTHLQAPHGLAVFEDSLFFLVSNWLKLNRCSLFGKMHCEPFIYRVLGADTFVLRHESAQRDDVVNLCEGFTCSNLCVLDEGRPLCLCDEGNQPVDGACRLLEKEQLPLFNGWTFEEYARAQTATLTAVACILGLCAVYLVVFLYYHFVHRPRVVRAGNYLEVRFQNAENSAASTTEVVEQTQPSSSGAGHEFVNPLGYVRDLWEEVRRNKRPVGTAGLDINIPYVQEDLSDTESDLDDRDTKSIIRK